VVRAVFRRLVERRDSLGAIARWLRKAAAPRRRSWTAADVRQLLSSSTYAGLGPGPGEPPPLVDGATWRRAQEILAARARHGRARESRYLLSGLLRCRRCGAAMTGHRHRPAGRSGRCEVATYECSHKGPESSRCRGSYLSAAKAHRLLSENLRALSESQRSEPGRVEFSPMAAPEGPSPAEMRGRLAHYPRQLDRLLRRYREGAISAAGYATARRKLEAERSAAAQSLTPAASRPPPRPASDDEPVCCLADVLESNRFGAQLKKDLLWEAFHHITIDRDGTVKLWGRVWGRAGDKSPEAFRASAQRTPRRPTQARPRTGPPSGRRP
jgi:hypothetical protein